MCKSRMTSVTGFAGWRNDDESIRVDDVRGSNSGRHWSSDAGLGLRGATPVLSPGEVTQGTALRWIS